MGFRTQRQPVLRPPVYRPARRRRWWRPVVIVLVVALLAASALAAYQLRRAVPGPRLTLRLPPTVRLPGPAPRLPWPTAGEAALDVEGVGSLGSVGAERVVPIASVAKVMTAYVVLTDHPLTVTGSGPRIRLGAADVADYRARLAGGQSVVRVRTGEVLTERQALEAMLLPSANNIAATLARWDAGSLAAFVARMNRTAARLGLRHTRYADPAGILPQTVSTAADQVTLAEAALRLPTFAAIVALRRVRLPVAGEVHNIDRLLGRAGVVGVKTGSTTAAGGCFVFAARRVVAGRAITVVGAVLGQPVAGVGLLPEAFRVTSRLLAAAVGAIRPEQVLTAGSPAGGVRLAWGGGPAVVVGPAVLVGWGGLVARLSLRPGSVPIRAPAGTRVGTVAVTLGGRTSVTRLRLTGPVPAPTLRWRLLRAIS